MCAGIGARLVEELIDLSTGRIAERAHRPFAFVPSPHAGPGQALRCDRRFFGRNLEVAWSQPFLRKLRQLSWRRPHVAAGVARQAARGIALENVGFGIRDLCKGRARKIGRPRPLTVAALMAALTRRRPTELSNSP